MAMCGFSNGMEAVGSKGGDIVGEAENDASGWSVSLSADGSIVAIGAPFNDGNGEGSGHVRVFEWDGSSWIQRGVDIDGESGDINTGWRVSLSADGSIVASSTPFNCGSIGQSGQVRVYEYSCDVVEGCTNSMAENFNPSANVDDGSCEYPPGFNTCGDPVSYQGYDYATVLIGEQCWFAENLRSENYENGDAIPANLSWIPSGQTRHRGPSLFTGKMRDATILQPDIDACDPAQSLNEYGRLYNWYAVDDARGLCPSGWHVPTDGEWTVLTDHLGGVSIAGGPMKTDYGWHNGGNGTNSSGFSGLPGGIRNSSGNFQFAGNYGYWWSSSPSGSNAWYRFLLVNEYVGRFNFNLQNGFSVRCVRDAE